MNFLLAFSAEVDELAGEQGGHQARLGEIPARQVHARRQDGAQEREGRHGDLRFRTTLSRAARHCHYSE